MTDQVPEEVPASSKQVSFAEFDTVVGHSSTAESHSTAESSSTAEPPLSAEPSSSTEPSSAEPSSVEPSSSAEPSLAPESSSATGSSSCAEPSSSSSAEPSVSVGHSSPVELSLSAAPLPVEPPSVAPLSVQPPPMQPPSVQSPPMQPESIQPSSVQPPTVQLPSVQPLLVQPSLHAEPTTPKHNSNALDSTSRFLGMEKHKAWYLADGNIILLAENMLFRGYRGLLAMHSPLFRDMFSMPQPGDAETFEGCPVVRLQDSAFHIEWLFSALYAGPVCSLYVRGQELSTRSTVAILELGFKYDIEPFRKEILRRLKNIYPTTFDDAIHGSKRRLIKSKDCVVVVSLARRFNLDHLLPMALYACCQMSLSELYDLAAKQGNGHNTDTPSGNQLSTEDLELCLQAIPQLYSHSLNIVKAYTDENRETRQPACIASKKCSAVALRLFHEVMKKELLIKPSSFIHPDEEINQIMKSYCQPCYTTARAEIHARRLAMWNDLGVIFKVPSWQTNLAT
ncbi:hypothetical protein BDW22DRAFT_1357039 [Trametopsis cervina]|nr:hypothetical protein BDW22DRAFT_1357039 [Trametopsis cervina]